MKDKFQTIISVITCVLLVVCLFQIGNLQSQIRRDYNNLRSDINNVNHEMRSISSNVSYTLEQKASIIAAESYGFGEFHAEDLTVDFNAEITPKEYDDASTVATLYLSGEPFKMTKDGGTFKLTTPIGVFDQIQSAKVEFREGNTVRVEDMEWYMNPRDEAIVRTYASAAWGWTAHLNNEDKIYEWVPNGSIDVDVNNQTEQCKLKSGVIKFYLDGECIETYPVEFSESDYIEQGVASSLYGTVPFYEEESVDIPYGSTFAVTAVVTDTLGLQHVNLVEYITVDENGGQDAKEQEWIWRHGEEIIYDAEGSIIYNPYEGYNSELGVMFTDLLEGVLKP